MRSYERNGVTVDQCADCRGIFLDRGELERLIDAEAAFHAKQREPERDDRRPEPPRYDERKYDTDERHYGGYGGKKKKSRTSFLSELFE
jgi:Zn-finger nucleic acid-binding protein